MAESEAAIGFLGRVKLWLRIIFSGFGIGQMQVKSTAAQSRNVANRHKTRLHKRALPLRAVVLYGVELGMATAHEFCGLRFETRPKLGVFRDSKA